MFARYAILDSGGSLGDDVLDEIEGEALVIIEHPDRYTASTVSAARRALEAIQRLRGSGGGMPPALQSA